MAGLNPTFGYQWQDSPNGSTGWANIASATSQDYTITAAENTRYLRCVVTAANTGGSVSANSNVLGPITVAGLSLLPDTAGTLTLVPIVPN